MPNFKFVLKGKKFNLEIKECKTYFQKASGLMFRKKSPSLLFLFNKNNKSSIHSFFCIPFIAIWFSKDRIIDIKRVVPWEFYIIPKENFDKLLEIPENDDNYNKIINLID